MDESIFSMAMTLVVMLMVWTIFENVCIHEEYAKLIPLNYCSHSNRKIGMKLKLNARKRNDFMLLISVVSSVANDRIGPIRLTKTQWYRQHIHFDLVFGGCTIFSPNSVKYCVFKFQQIDPNLDKIWISWTKPNQFGVMDTEQQGGKLHSALAKFDYYL